MKGGTIDQAALAEEKGTMMRSMVRWSVGVAGVAALALAGCGGGDDGRATGETGIPDQFAATTAPPDGAEPGGELTVVAADDIDFMDPGATYYQFTYMVTTAGHRTLLAWRPDDTDSPTPDLAEDEPEVSEDGLEITFTIREGVRFSPPVDREVTAADVEYAIERGLLPGVANGYISIYLSDVVGFAAAEEQAGDDPAGGAPDIEGITAVDDRTLRIELERPTSATVIQALSLPISAPVPQEHAAQHDARNPSTYGEHVAFTGPYMVASDDEGELTGYAPGREIELVRNPNWDQEASGDFRPAYLDSIRIVEGFDDAASASRRILGGSGQVNGDISPPPAVIREAASEAEPGQLVASPSGGNRYITLNTRMPPFDDVDVRRAVFAATDRVALRNTRGGELIGPVASHFIPPEIPGFEEAGGVAGPDLDFVASPEGDPELAAEYMRAAGFESGRCEGECEISVVGDGASPSREATEVFVDTLEELGFEPQVRHVARDVMLTRFCDAPEQLPHVCPSIGWLKDFNDAASILQPTFDGEAISDAGNTNLSLLDDPAINDAIAEAALIVDRDERADAWGAVDTMIVEQAPAIPYTWDNQVNIRSADVAGVINLFNANWDLSFTSMSG